MTHPRSGTRRFVIKLYLISHDKCTVPSQSVAADVARIERSEIRDSLAAGPGFRFAQSGLQDQFRDRSTSARCLIQGIISRTFAPTCSIGCSASLARVALNEVWFTLFSSIQSLVKRPDWMSAKTFFISARVWSVMTRGPETYSPYSAVFDTEWFILAMPP